MTFLSDITTIDGKFLLPGVIDGTNENIPTSKLEWPNQNSPDKKTWKLWSQTITSIYCVSKHSTTIRRNCILGHWTSELKERLRLHSFYFSPSLDEIYETKTNGFNQYFADKIGTRAYNINIASKQTIEIIPADCIPAQKTGNTFNISISHAIPKFKRLLPNTFMEFILQQPPWIQDLTKKHKQYMNVDPLFSYIINNNNLIISTDGTTQTRKSGGSWIIALEDGTKIVSGNNPNFGPSEDITSYRTEVYACLASSLFLHLYSQFYMIKIKNKCKAICSNPKYVRQLSWLLEDDYHHHGLHKSTEQEAISIKL